MSCIAMSFRGKGVSPVSKFMPVKMLLNLCTYPLTTMADGVVTHFQNLC